MWGSSTAIETPNDLLAKMKQFLIVECGFTLVKDITDDLDIATSTFVEGQLCVVRDKLDKYYIIMRSANEYNIWGNTYTTNEDKVKKPPIRGIGITMTTEYDGTIPLWYNQKNVPLYFHNNYVVKHGIFLPVVEGNQNLLYCNYVEDRNIDIKLSPYTCMFSITSDGTIPEFNRTYNHVIFGNLKLYNTKNISSDNNGGFMISTNSTQHGDSETKTTKIRVGGTPVKQKQKVKTANILSKSTIAATGLFNGFCLAHLNINYGDYATQKYDAPYAYVETDIKGDTAKDVRKEDTNKVDADIVGDVWATSISDLSAPGDDEDSGFSYARFPRVVLPLSSKNTGAINLRNMTTESRGNANRTTPSPRTFGLPLILGIYTNPYELKHIAPVGEVYGVYFISMYDYNGASFHAVPCYEGSVYTQCFPTVQRSLVLYDGIAISNSYAFSKVYKRHSDPYGGGLGI